MSEESTKEGTKMPEESTNKLYWIIVLVSVLVTGANTGLNKVFPELRGDPFTGSQGAELRQLVYDKTGENRKQINEIKESINRLVAKMSSASNATYKKEQIRERLEVIRHRLEEQYSSCKSRTEKIESFDERMSLDIRNLYTLVAEIDNSHPPKELERDVHDNDVRINAIITRLNRIDKEHEWLFNKARGLTN